VRGRHKTDEEFQVTGVAERLVQYAATPDVTAHVMPVDVAEPELVERAARLLSVMSKRELRSTIEKLVSPNDLERGRRAIDVLIDTAFAIEDETGHLRKT
jgi:hypothetical protein